VGNIAEDIAEELMTIVAAVKLQDIDAALRHHQSAHILTQFAIRQLDVEIEIREYRQQVTIHLQSARTMYLEIQECLDRQKEGIEKLAVVLAEIQADRSGVVGQA